jgi:hypothetical protein
VLVGQTVRLRWRAFLPDKSIVNFPARPADDSTTHWRAWRTSTLAPNKRGVREHRLEAELQSFALGPVAVPGAPFRFRVPGEGVREGRFPTSEFYVGMTVPLDGPEPPLRDMKALVPPPWWALVPWAWIGAGLALALLLWWLVRRWLRARKDATQAGRTARGLRGPGGRGAPAPVGARRPPPARAGEDARARDRAGRSPAPLRRAPLRVAPAGLHHRGTGAPPARPRRRAARGRGRPARHLEACDLTKFARRPYDAQRAHDAEETAAHLVERWAPAPATAAPSVPQARAASGGAR